MTKGSNMKTSYLIQGRYSDEQDSAYLDIKSFDSKIEALDEAKRIKGGFDYMAIRVLERKVKTEDTVIEQH